jgi:hypothetical protein
MKLKSVVLGLILCFALLGVSTGSVDAQNGTELVVVAPETVKVCNNFTVTVAVINVNELDEVKFYLTWDASLMEYIEVEVLTWGSPSAYSYQANRVEGWLNLSMWSTPSFSGTTDLVNIVFHCNGTGTSTLELFDTELWVNGAFSAPIPHTVVDGTVTQIFEVGGEVVSVDLWQLVTPYLFIGIAVTSTATVFYRKRYL